MIYIGEPVQNLDTLPFPARDLIKEQGGNVFAYNQNYIGCESTQILTSRSCIGKCAFCARYSYPARIRSVKSVITEIKQVIDTTGIRQFRIADDNFCINKTRILELCERLASLDIVFRISTRVNNLDRKILQAMKGAGLVEISLGVESFDDNVLKGLKKGTRVANNVKAIENCMDIGITTRVLMMIKTPFQTKKTIEQNVKWLTSLEYDIVCCTFFMPLPGSDIWKHPDNYKITILNKNLDDYNFYLFDNTERREIPNVIQLWGRDENEVNAETQFFLDFLEDTEKVNRG